MDAPVVRRAAQVGAAIAARARAGVVRAPARAARRPPARGRVARARPHRVDQPHDRLPRRVRPRNPVDRPLEHLTADEKPICASSPAARIVVVTSSVPVGAPSGLGGGVVVRRPRGGEPRRTQRAATPRAARPRASRAPASLRRGGGFARGAASRRRARARGRPMRSGRLAGSVPSTLGGSRLAFAFALGSLSAIASIECTPGTRRAPPAIMRRRPPHSHRAASRSAGYRTGHKLRVEVDNRSA